MENKNKSKLISFTGLFIALGILLPMAFHSLGAGGPAFLPMHIPALVGGLVLGPLPGLIIGVLSPVLSSILTGMPPVFPMLPIMVFELGTYGLLGGYLRKKRKMGIYPSLLLAMVMGRLVILGVVLVLNTKGFNQGPLAYVAGSLVSGLPGLLIQLVFIPPVVKLVEKIIKE